MEIRTTRSSAAAIATLREAYLRQLECQMVHYSFIGRGLSDVYVATAGGHQVGYAAISNRYDKGRLNEFFVIPDYRKEAPAIFRELLKASGAAHIEAQTNSALPLEMLREFGTNERVEKLLFGDGPSTALSSPEGSAFRERRESDGPGMFGQPEEVAAQWVVEAAGDIVAAGGFLTHYNPPYGDLFMETSERARRRGFGGFLVQELRRVCREAGRIPAGRCDPANEASRKTLLKGGMRICGELLVAEVRT